MKRLLFSAVSLSALLMTAGTCNAQSVLTSSQLVESRLGDAANRNELTRINTGVTGLLKDARLTDQATRQMLEQSQTVLNEMLNLKAGSNVEKLLDFSKWMRSQSLEKAVIHDAGGAKNPQQQFVLDNPLAGEEVYLTSIIYWILDEFVGIDRSAAGDSKLEGYLRLYLDFGGVVEGGKGIPNGLLFETPEWTKQRFLQLTVDQKRQFFKDVKDARADSALPLLPDEVPASPRPPQEQAAYEAAYQFILSNTPPQ